MGGPSEKWLKKKHEQIEAARAAKQVKIREGKGKVLEGLKAGGDLEAAAGLAMVQVQTVKGWWRRDEEFKMQCKAAMEANVMELIQKCKAEGGTAWKLLKNLARGRFRDDPEMQITGNNVQIVFGIPRPEHKVEVLEDIGQKALESAEEAVDGDD